MRKLIIGIALLLVAVLCLSNLSRISNGIFDKFFSDDSTLNSGGSSDSGNSGGSSDGGNSGGSSDSGNSGGSSDSGNSGGSSDSGNSGGSSDSGNSGGSSDGGNSGGSSGEGNTGEYEYFVVYEPAFNEPGNLIVDYSTYEKCGSFYYYPVNEYMYAQSTYLFSEYANESSMFLTVPYAQLYMRTFSDVFTETNCPTILFDASRLLMVESYNPLDSFNIGYTEHKLYYETDCVYTNSSSIAGEYSLVTEWINIDSGSSVYLYAYFEKTSIYGVRFFLTSNLHTDLTNPSIDLPLYLYKLSLTDQGDSVKVGSFVES